MIELRENYWAVEVPDDANGFKITDKSIGFYDGQPSLKDIRFIHLPPGTWEIVCTSKAITNDHASDIVDRAGEGWIDYDKDNFHYDIPLPDPMQSFETMLTSKGCDKDKTFLILKKLQ